MMKGEEQLMQWGVEELKDRLAVAPNVQYHGLICEELHDLYTRKNADYGDSFSKSFKQFGLTMCAIRLSDKYNRFLTLISNEQQVNDESIRDTLIDLANYAIMSVMELDNVKGTKF